jgi:transcriptional regulator with XRE-family HTH domain
MTFGEQIKRLRKARNFSQRDLAGKVKVSFTYISKIENEKLDFGDYPSEELILKLAKALEANADELLLLAKKIPESVRKRVIQRPDVFRKLAALDDERLDKILEDLGDECE